MDPRLVLRLWARRFLDSFAATHPWPPAVRAAMILRKQRRRRFSLDQLAIRTGASRSVLTRGFQRHYGMSAAEYHRRAKLQWCLEQIRQPQSNVESIALRAGFSSLSSLCRSLRLQTGLAPSEIRRLSNDSYRDLFDGPLSVAVSRLQGGLRRKLQVGGWNLGVGS